MILHGTEDEIVPFDAVRDFAESDLMEFLPLINADHRFIDPALMSSAIHKTMDFICK